MPKYQRILMHHSCLMAILFLNNSAMQYPQKALVINPVVDLIASPLEKIKEQNTAIKEYTDMAFAPKIGACACPRLHQLVFNEIVTIIQEQDNQVCIEIPNLFFQTSSSDKKHTRYWAEKKHFKLLPQINIAPHYLPTPIEMNSNQPLIFSHTITLIEPYQNPITNVLYSAGTRFVYNRYKNKQYQVYAYDPESDTCNIISIPNHLCINNEKQIPIQSSIKKFVRLLKRWAQKPGFIAYVWGGCSFTHRLSSDEFYEKKDNENTVYERNTKCIYAPTDSTLNIALHEIPTNSWNQIDHAATSTHNTEHNNQIPQNNQHNPPHNHLVKTGMDCSGMISRAAQACNMPYFFKNSTTVRKNLEEVTDYKQLAIGDIIWMPGHVMVVSSIKQNSIVEAAGYQKGFGKIQELPLNKTFKNVNTYKDLLALIIKKEPVQRLDVHGKPAQTINEIAILRLQSIWPCAQSEETDVPQCNMPEQRK